MCWWPVSSTTWRKRHTGEWFRPLFLEFATLRLGIATGEELGKAKLDEAKVPSQSEAVALWKSWASSFAEEPERQAYGALTLWQPRLETARRHRKTNQMMRLIRGGGNIFTTMNMARYSIVEITPDKTLYSPGNNSPVKTPPKAPIPGVSLLVLESQ